MRSTSAVNRTYPCATTASPPATRYRTLALLSVRMIASTLRVSIREGRRHYPDVESGAAVRLINGHTEQEGAHPPPVFAFKFATLPLPLPRRDRVNARPLRGGRAAGCRRHGEVYRARDLQLGRDVAIKVPAEAVLRLSRKGGSGGPGLPLEEALSIAGQIAEALEAAHEKGIVH